MQRTLPTPQGSDSNALAFVTIDDMQELANRLLSGLNRLSGYRYPLAVRKGYLERVEKAKEGIQIKATSSSYFLTLAETETGEQYPKITESHYQRKDATWTQVNLHLLRESPGVC